MLYIITKINIMYIHFYFLNVIVESNFLIRKQCNHKDVFDCECNLINFDFVLMDYDYVHEEGTVIQDPTHTGTFQYRALPLLVRIYTYV